MGKINGIIALFLTLIIAMSCLTLLTVKQVNAETIPKPAIPEFRLRYTNNIYDVPAATSQWSGEPIPNTAHHVDYRNIYVEVRNYPNDGYVNYDSYKEGIRQNLYYNVRVKNHFSNDWIETYGQRSVYAANGSIIIGTWYWQASGTEVTTIGSFTLNGPTNIIHSSKDAALGDEVDFQVKALIGYQNFEKQSFTGEESEWSGTQTIDFSDTSVSISPTQNPSPTVPELSWFVIVPLLLLAPLILTVLLRKKLVAP